MRRASAVLWFSVAVILLITGACSTDVAVLAEVTSPPRSAGEGAAGNNSPGGAAGGKGAESGAGKEEACAWIKDLQANPPPSINVDEDPEAAAAAAEEFRRFTATAPKEIQPDLEVYADMLDRLVELGNKADGDMADGFGALNEMFEVFLDPKIIAAGERLQRFMVNECGLTPGEAANAFGGAPGESTGDPGAGGAANAPVDITLDDIEAMEQAHKGESWVDKVSSRSIVNDQDISLSTGGFGDPFTEQEALAACEAVRDAFKDRQPQLTVEIGNEDIVVVSGAAGQPCKPA